MTALPSDAIVPRIAAAPRKPCNLASIRGRVAASMAGRWAAILQEEKYACDKAFQADKTQKCADQMYICGQTKNKNNLQIDDMNKKGKIFTSLNTSFRGTGKFGNQGRRLCMHRADVSSEQLSGVGFRMNTFLPTARPMCDGNLWDVGDNFLQQVRRRRPDGGKKHVERRF